MPEFHVLPKDELFKLLDRAMKEKPVMGPKLREDQPGFYYFGWLNSPEEFVADYVTTTMPPKKAFFPPSQVLFTYELDYSPVLVDAAETSDFILAGVHPCDLAAIDQLDLAYGYPPTDARWQHERRRSTIIGIDCMPDEYCFCTTVQTCDARKPADVFLTSIKRGYFAEILTAKGNELLKQCSLATPLERDLKDVQDWQTAKARAITARFNVSIPEFADILQEGGLSPVWHDVSNRCYSCGSCNTTCPTCFCFDVTDDLELDLRHGARKRTWDSCQLLEFALVAGLHNFRGERWQRVRHRWHRKFLYLYRKYGRPYCTGCGRCSRACTVDINIVDVSNQLIEYSRRGEQP